jgi:hypothetical protein
MPERINKLESEVSELKSMLNGSNQLQISFSQIHRGGGIRSGN